MDQEIGFQMFKYATIAQNRALLKQIAKDFGLNESRLMERYLKQEYYLPVVQITSKNDRRNARSK
jgi:hypothetical protein